MRETSTGTQLLDAPPDADADLADVAVEEVPEAEGAPRRRIQPMEAPHETRHAASGHRVLIVEDDPDLRETLGTIVEAEGYVVMTARNGREALARLVEGFQPSVILVDLLMPVMDGWQLCEEISADAQLGNIPIILMSASGGPFLPPRPANLVRLFRKPFTFVQLLEAIAKGCEAAPPPAAAGPVAPIA